MAEFQVAGKLKGQELILPPKLPTVRLGSSGKAAPAPETSVRGDETVTSTGKAPGKMGAWDLDSEQKTTVGAKEV